MSDSLPCTPKQTYGQKPNSFQLEENGEFYYIGSEVTTMLSFF